jgi:metal-sulfur cluster biosynthetic enzyme
VRVTRAALPASANDLDRQVNDALGRVYDPCSVAVNNPLSIVDMGLVRDWRVDDEGHISVVMCVTGPGCMMFPKFIDAARNELTKLDFVSSVEVRMDLSVLWTEDLMTDRGRQLQNQRHRRTYEISPVQPRQWRKATPGT